MEFPHSPEAERSLLGCFLMAEQAILEAGHVEAADFHVPQNRAVFDAITSVRSDKRPVDLVTVGDELTRAGFKNVATEIITIASEVPSWSSAKYYADIVRRHSTNRRLIAICSSISHQAALADAGDDILARARVSLAELETRNGGEPMRLGDGLQGVFDRVTEKAKDKEAYRVPSGIPKFDAEIGGFRAPQLVVIAARPGVGKTALAGNVILRAATRGVPSLIFSLEMSFDELAERFIGADARFPVDRITRGQVSYEDYKKLYSRAPKLSELPLYIDDRVLNIAQIEATARLWRIKQPAKQAIIVIDYLGLIRASDRAENRNLEVGAMTRAAKMLAKDLICPVILVAQLNRAMEKENREPILSDLRDSGEIEAHADMVIFPHREMTANGSGPATLIVPKHRGGKTGRITCWWHGEFMTYDGLATDEEF